MSLIIHSASGRFLEADSWGAARLAGSQTTKAIQFPISHNFGVARGSGTIAQRFMNALHVCDAAQWTKKGLAITAFGDTRHCVQSKYLSKCKHHWLSALGGWG